MANQSLKDIPGYAEAVNRESLLRESAFLAIPQDICGYAISPFTLRHYLTLKLIRSPFLTGRTPSPNDIQAALWILNPHQDSASRRAHWRQCRAFTPPELPTTRNRFIINMWKRRYQRRIERASKIVFELRQFIDDALMDFPPSPAHSNGAVSYYGDGAWICGSFARHFGWTDDYTLDVPMARLLQYLKVIADFNGVKSPHFNPSDLVCSRWLKEVNTRKN